MKMKKTGFNSWWNNRSVRNCNYS